MKRQRDGTWTVRGPASWRGATYTFDVTVWSPSAGEVVTNRVTDPYSVALTTNSEQSLLVDLADPAPGPGRLVADHAAGDRAARGPQRLRAARARLLDRRRDRARPPSAAPTSPSPATARAGMQHLRRLADAGLNTVHLLPVFDIATIEERRSAQQAARLRPAPRCRAGLRAAAGVRRRRCAADDGFNWGYDPLHYTTPGGLLRHRPRRAPRRTVEFRRMVQGAQRRRAAGRDGRGLQPHRAPPARTRSRCSTGSCPATTTGSTPSGAVETSTCCANTATEHAMMEKLMIDSVLTWARDYKVDGFRFDLMGHHSQANMLAVRAALDRLTVAARRRRRQGDLPLRRGLELRRGRRRRALRPGHAGATWPAPASAPSTTGCATPCAAAGRSTRTRAIQGFGSGLFTDPNGAAVNGTADEQRDALLHDAGPGQARAGRQPRRLPLPRLDRRARWSGAEVDYNGQPAGYAADPQETVTYVDAHDNETLFDSLRLQAAARARRWPTGCG